MLQTCYANHAAIPENIFYDEAGHARCKECARRAQHLISMRTPSSQFDSVGRLSRLRAKLSPYGIILQFVEGDCYDILDIWWDLCEHFQQPRSFPDMTRRRMGEREAIIHAERCMRYVRWHYKKGETCAT